MQTGEVATHEDAIGGLSGGSTALSWTPMARGDILPSERREFTQPETGVRAIQLTSAACANVNAYYNYEQFIGDSLVFYSDRSGVRQIYKVEIDSGKIVQLTDAPVDVGNFAAVPDLGRVYYACGDEVRALDAETLSDEPVAARLPGCGRPGLEDVSSCGRYLVLSARPERVVAETSPETSFRLGSGEPRRPVRRGAGRAGRGLRGALDGGAGGR